MKGKVCSEKNTNKFDETALAARENDNKISE